MDKITSYTEIAGYIIGVLIAIVIGYFLLKAIGYVAKIIFKVLVVLLSVTLVLSSGLSILNAAASYLNNQKIEIGPTIFAIFLFIVGLEGISRYFKKQPTQTIHQGYNGSLNNQSDNYGGREEPIWGNSSIEIDNSVKVAQPEPEDNKPVVDQAYENDRYNRWSREQTKDSNGLGSVYSHLFGNSSPPDDFE